MQEWLRATASDLGRGIAGGQIDPVTLTDTYLAAIAVHPYRDRIYARVTADRARAEAQAARDRARSGHRLSLLDGVPVSWKDLFDTAGTATEAGTALMAGRIPSRDAEVLKRATAAGLVCLGKTHMTEIAFSGLGLNPITATPPNRHDPTLAPGGSSSGAAASVAYGLAAAGIGSDTGGSVRVPSGWNDLVGFKPTHGRLPLTGVVPLCLTFDTVGPLCRSVEDAAQVFAVLDGAKPVDLQGASLAGARFLVLDTIATEGVRDAPATAFARAVTRLQAAGATVDRGGFEPLRRAFDMAGPLYTADAWAWWKDRIEAAPDKMYHQILTRIRAGAGILAADYIAGWATLTEIRREWCAAMAGYDAVIMPTLANLPPVVAELEADPAFFVSENLLALRNTRVANLMGLCALTIPTGVPSCGLMLNALPGQELRLLRLGAATEAALA